MDTQTAPRTCIVCRTPVSLNRTCGSKVCQHVHLHAVLADGCACKHCKAADLDAVRAASNPAR